MIINGIHHFGAVKIGIRKDYCNYCERECVAEEWRSFDAWHLFWIPVIPLGRRRRWLCTLCNQDPRARYRTGTWMKVAGAVVLALLAWSSYSLPVEPGKAFGTWAVRILFTLGFFTVLLSLIPSQEVTEADGRAGITPLDAEECFYCHGPLKPEPDLHCPACKIRVYTEMLPPKLADEIAGKKDDADEEPLLPPRPAPEFAAIFAELKAVCKGDFCSLDEKEIKLLSDLKFPEPVLSFYRGCCPEWQVANDQGIGLCGIAGLLYENEDSQYALVIKPPGFLVFATNGCGDAFCFDLNHISTTGHPRIVLFSHEMMDESCTGDDVKKLAKPVAADLKEFLGRFVRGEVDEEPNYNV